jgi:hypothetical protein
MCLDIWITFKRIRPQSSETPKYGWNHSQFKWYALWSWGGSGLVTTVTLVIEHLPTHMVSHLNLPELGQVF